MIVFILCLHLMSLQPSFLPMKSDSPPVCPVSIPVSENTHFRVITHETSSEQCVHSSEMSASTLLRSEDTVVTQQTIVTLGMETESTSMESLAVTSETQVTTVESAAARTVADMEETMLRLCGKTDSPTKKKGDKAWELYKLSMINHNN